MNMMDCKDLVNAVPVNAHLSLLQPPQLTCPAQETLQVLLSR